MIHAIVLHIVLLHAQMTVPWIGGAKVAAAPAVATYRPLVLRTGVALVLRTGTPFVVAH